MKIESKIYDIKGVRSFETYLAATPVGKRPEYLKFFINEVGVIRRQLPTEANENELLNELVRVMKTPPSPEIIKTTGMLLKKDRITRYSINTSRIFEQPISKIGLQTTDERER